jgi:hypothetical protein
MLVEARTQRLVRPSAGLSALVWQRACCLLLRLVRPVSGRQKCCAGVAVCWQLCNLGCQQRVVDTLQLLSAHMVTISNVCVLADVQPGVCFEAFRGAWRAALEHV